MKKIIYLLIVILIVGFGYMLYAPGVEDNLKTQDENVGMANPASLNCQKQGGNLQIKEKEDDSQYGLCYFDDNRACEEWAMFRGDCPVGGVKTTGYDTVDQMFCAWSGGQTFAEANSKCTFKNGKVCSTLDFYKGVCTN